MSGEEENQHASVLRQRRHAAQRAIAGGDLSRINDLVSCACEEHDRWFKSASEGLPVHSGMVRCPQRGLMQASLCLPCERYGGWISTPSRSAICCDLHEARLRWAMPEEVPSRYLG
jgi:hypothetical protein